MASQITGVSIVYSIVHAQKTSKLHVTGLCEVNSPVTGEFPAQRAIDGEMFPFDDVFVCKERYHSQNVPCILSNSTYLKSS